MIKTKVAFLEDRLFSNQSGLFENFSDCSDWLVKSRTSRIATCFDHVDRLYTVYLFFLGNFAMGLLVFLYFKNYR